MSVNNPKNLYRYLARGKVIKESYSRIEIVEYVNFLQENACRRYDWITSDNHAGGLDYFFITDEA